MQDAKLQTLLIDYKNTVLKAQQEVENGLAGFLQGRQQVAFLRRSVAAASSALSVALDQYLLGTRDFTTVLTAEQNLYQAQSNLAAAEGSSRPASRPSTGRSAADGRYDEGTTS